MKNRTSRRRASAAVALLVLASAPLAAQARGRTPPAAPSNPDSLSTQAPVRQSWTSDRMRFGIGDIITILIDERTAASANLTDNNTETRKKAMGLDIQPPSTPGQLTAGPKVTMDFNNDGDSRKNGQAIRQNDFRSQLSARVIAVSPTGMLKIRGHKLVNVDKNQQDVTVTGWIRPQDIAVGSNTIASSRVADAEVDYGQTGALGKPRSGILSKVLGAIWP
ncbi:MAG: flagellar basal body L-ring protein FlgH [Gemmatimonadales bacterium]